MMNDDCSRRVFLKKFALLSTGTLMLGATVMACYGPGPNRPSPSVSGIFFLDAASQPVPLQDNQSVPVNTKFTIEFSIQMNTVFPATVAFADYNDVPVSFNKAWISDYTLGVVPTSSLLFDTQYRLSLSDAVSRDGEQLLESADATFRTVVA